MPDAAVMQAGSVPVRTKKNSKVLQVLKQMSYNRMAMLGAVILLIEVVLVLLAPLIAPYSYSTIDMSVAMQGPSLAHPFGTDDVGRDILSRILIGGRYSLGMGILSILISMVLGISIGSIAGYFGGTVDNLIMRFLDIVQSMPGMLMTIVLSTVLGPGYFNTILALAINNIPSNARLLRAQMLKVRENEYIEAARSINCNKLQIIVKHLIPNSFSPMIVTSTMGVAHMITAAAGLSFIGLGVQPPTPEWGAMLSASRQFIRSSPHMVIFPGLAIAITVLSLNLMGDGLRDALDPKLKR
ncbi:ABC transporter permease [Gemmiger sp. An120]|uniref:ABC transporter permease n=1 Tax=Gemmiger sp. An120 TaxID=1965549 RepID=UPI001FA8D00B|nr:ABC transporter permease [Gemmiger sp. An120]